MDWGAQKLEFTCPDCEEDLVIIGGTTGKTKSKPSLRRPAPARTTGPKRVTSFDTDDDAPIKPIAGADDSDEAAGADFDDDDVNVSSDDDAVVEVDDSDD